MNRLKYWFYKPYELYLKSALWICGLSDRYNNWRLKKFVEYQDRLRFLDDEIEDIKKEIDK